MEELYKESYVQLLQELTEKSNNPRNYDGRYQDTLRKYKVAKQELILAQMRGGK